MMKNRTLWLAILLLTTCNHSRSLDDDAEIGDMTMAWNKGHKPTPPCTRLSCHISTCHSGNRTTLSGTVTIPAGNLPLNNATVYVPDAALDPITTGPSCNRCDAELSGSAIVHTTTDIYGHFTLEGVPDGEFIPLVIQLGKWRRQVLVPLVIPCTDNTAGAELTRLPRNHLEGDIPKIALTTGSADALECLLRKIGIDDSEFTPQAGSGRVNLYNGDGGTDHYDASLNGGAALTPGPTFWEQLDNLKQYDVVMHSCEGLEISSNKSSTARQALLDYLNMGGRVFASHWHSFWLEFGAGPLPTVATFNHRTPPPDPTTVDIDTSFDHGAAFADWLINVGASTQRGKLDVQTSRNTIQTVNAALAQRWIYIPALDNVQYFSFKAPVGADEKKQCGRMVFTDIHVSSGDLSNTSVPFPTGCHSSGFSPQEKALIYMFFDLSNCLAPVIG